MASDPPSEPGDDSFPVTDDRLLGHRVEYRQRREGLRATVDPVLLAAAVPARSGDRVLEGGTGAGAALLCLAARVLAVHGVGVDRDIGLLRLARANAAANSWPDLRFVAADLAHCPITAPFDHAFANPPYHSPDGTRSGSAAHESARRSAPDTVAIWVKALSLPLRHRGTLTLIVPPRMLETALKAMRDNMTPAECVFPIRSRAEDPARVVLIRGRKHGRAPLVLASGLVLHGESGTFAPAAEAILRDAAPLRLDPV